MTKLSNETIWNGLRDKFPSFASHTAKATREMFTERGFEQLQRTDILALDDFWGLTLRVYLQFVNPSRAKDTLSEKGFGETYDVPFGAILQRISTESVKPISPAYKGLKNGDAPNPFVVRKPVVHERFFRQNFDYASLITMPDDFTYKTIFVNEYGMDSYMSGVMEGLANGYTIQKYENKLEAINAFLNGTGDNALKDSMIYEVNQAGDVATADELTDLVLAMKNAAEAMELGPQTDAFNVLGHKDTQDAGRLKVLIRPGYKTRLETLVQATTYHDKNLALPADIIVVENFGGLIPTSDGNTEVYPVYNELGEVIGFNTVNDSDTVTIQEKDIKYKDPNKDVIAIMADKGIVFEGIQNPYQVEPIRNPRGRYTNYWASSPNNTIAVDRLYNAIVFKKK